MPLDLRLDIPTFDAAALPAAAAVLDLSLPGRLSVDGPLAIRARTQGTVDQLSVEGSVDATRAAVRWGTDFAKLGDLALEAGVSGARDAGRTEIRHASLRLGGLQVDATGTVRPGEAVDVRIDSNRAGIAALAAVLPAAAGVDIGGDVEAHLTIQGPLATETLPAISGTVALDRARARRPEDTLGVSDLTTTITLGDGVARMPATRFRLGDGSVEASGTFVLADRLLTIERASGDLFGGSAEGSAPRRAAASRAPALHRWTRRPGTSPCSRCSPPSARASRRTSTGYSTPPCRCRAVADRRGCAARSRGRSAPTCATACSTT